MNNKIDAAAKTAEHNGYGMLSVVCPMSLPPYTYSLAFADMLVENGVDVLFMPFMMREVRMPWMMGGTEQAVDVEGYRSGVTADMNFELMCKVREKYPETPIVAVSFYDDILGYGIARFADKCRAYAIDGLDTPGYSLVTSRDYARYGVKMKDAMVHIIHPLSTEIALSEEGTRGYDVLTGILQASGGFVFIMADSGGKSGATGALPVERLKPAVKRIREVQQKIGNICPIVTVCGISTPQNCQEAVSQSGSDGVLMASAVIRMIQADEPLDRIGAYIRSMKQGLKK